VRGVNDDADLLVRLGAGDGPGRGILMVDFAFPERGQEKNQSHAKEAEKKPEKQ